MGCGSSEAEPQRSKLLSNIKPAVWLIGGGPGSEKGKLCDSIVRDYKFKYLSSYDIVQFEQDRGGPDAEQIRKIYQEKKSMRSDLIVRLVKKAIASCGVRRFLIDGFPNSLEDISQFTKELSSDEIDFYGYLFIKISEQKMIASGLEVHKADKNKNMEEIEKNVREIVRNYVKESNQIKGEFQKQKKYVEINGELGVDAAYENVRKYFGSISIEPPQPVRIFFAHFDDVEHENVFCDDLVKKYGLYFYTVPGLIFEARAKTNSPEGEFIRKCQKQNKQVPPSVVLSLVRKKIEKHDYQGSFLISGYPRTVEDSEEWDRNFGWETNVLGYLTFQIPDEKFKIIYRQKLKKQGIKEEEIMKKFEEYQANQITIGNYYKKKELLLKINAGQQKEALKSIHIFFKSKNFHARPKVNNSQLIFLSTLCGNGEIVNQFAKQHNVKVLKFNDLLETKIKNNGLYSQLIESFMKIGKPVSGIVSVKILIESLMAECKNKSKIIVEGFPNSDEQLQSWEQEVGESISLCGIILYGQDQKYIQADIKQKIKKQKYFDNNNRITTNEKDAVEVVRENAAKLENKVRVSGWPYKVISNGPQSEIEKFLKDQHFV